MLPILIPVYIYFVTRDKFVDTSDNRSTALDTHHNFPKRVQQNRATSQKNGQPRYSIPSSATENDRRVLAEKTLSTEDISSRIITDSTLIPQHYYKLNFLSTRATKSCSGFCMSEFSLILVLQKKQENPDDGHGKDTN